MKYIRTKDGIYKCVDYDNECIIPMPIIKYEGILTHCAECDIIKQADTIEELCDEFVAYHKTSKLTYCIKKTPFKEQDENFNIYGAIWTGKGLIYVAKMNSKERLELL